MNKIDQAIIDALDPYPTTRSRLNTQTAHDRDAWIMRMATEAGPVRPGLHTTLAYQGLTEFPD